MKNVKQKFAQSTAQKYLLIRFIAVKTKLTKNARGAQ